MPAPGANPSRLNPKLKLRLVLDAWPPTKVREYDHFTRSMDDMALAKYPGTEAIGEPLLTCNGWTTKPQLVADDAEHTASLMAGTIASGLQQTAVGRQSAKPGAYSITPATTLMQVMSNPYSADGSSNFNVSSGHTGPGWDLPAPIERWFVSSTNYAPDVPIQVGFRLPANTAQGPFMRVYVNGPWGCKAGVVGDGRYCLTLFLDGAALLEEWNGSAWFTHSRWKAFTQSHSGGDWCILRIRSDARYDSGTGAWTGTLMSVEVGHADLISVLTSLAIQAIGGDSGGGGGDSASIIVNDGSRADGSVTLGPTMIEVRRDVAAQVHVSTLVQPAGDFWDKPFTLTNGDVDTDVPILMTWRGRIPGGTGLGAKLYGTTDGTNWFACTAADDATALPNGWAQQMKLIPGALKYRVRFTLTPSTGGVTNSSIAYYRLYRPGSYDFVTSIQPKIIDRFIEDVFVDDGGTDPTQNTAQVVFYHDGHLADPLELRDEIPIRIEADIKDPRDSETDATAVLFVGRIKPCVSERSTRKLYDGQKPGTTRKCTLHCIGEGIRLMEMISSSSFPLTDPSGASSSGGGAKMLKVTDAIKMVVGESGTPSDGLASMLDCPDLGIRLMPSDSEKDHMFIQAYDDLYEPVKRWVEDYLGYRLSYDTSAIPAGADQAVHQWGMFRVLPYPQGTEDAIARFVEDVPSYDGQDDTLKAQMVWQSYVDRSVEAGERIAVGPVEHGQFSHWVVGPEMNKIVTTGIGVPPKGGNTLGKISGMNKLLSEICNYKSAKFFDGQTVAPDPTSPDFIGHVRVTYDADSGYSTQQIADNVAKRRMRMAGQGYYMRQFTAPLLFMWDSTDELQVRPRALKFGDIAEYVEGETVSKWILSRVRLIIHQQLGGSAHAKAIYEMHSPLPEGDWVISHEDES